MWREKYKKKKFYWGTEPSKMVVWIVKKLKEGDALDIGSGEGRNTIFLARHNFAVDAIDKERVGIQKLKKYINKTEIKNINAQVIDIRDFKFKKKYNLIIAIHIFDFLKFSQIKRIFQKIRKSLKNNGFFYVSVFSTKDPAYNMIVKKLKKKEIEKGTFFLPKLNSYRHFFTISELKEIFLDWIIVKIKHKCIRDYHVDIGYHKHCVIDVIVKKSD